MQLSNNMLNLKNMAVGKGSNDATKNTPSEGSDVFSHILKNESKRAINEPVEEAVKDVESSISHSDEVLKENESNQTASQVVPGLESISKGVEAPLGVPSSLNIKELKDSLSTLIDGVESSEEIVAIFEEFSKTLPDDIVNELAEFVESTTAVITSSQLINAASLVQSSVNKLSGNVDDAPKISFKEAQDRAGASVQIPMSPSDAKVHRAIEAPVVSIEGIDDLAASQKDVIQNASKADGVALGLDKTVATQKPENMAGAAVAKNSAASIEQKSQGAVEIMKGSAWGKSVGQRAILMAQYGPRTLEIQLDPPELGTLQVRINLGQNDQINVQFASQNAGVREAIESHQSRLREMFDSAGLKLANSDVSDGNSGQKNDSNNQSNSNGLPFSNSDEKTFSEVNRPVGLVDFYA